MVGGKKNWVKILGMRWVVGAPIMKDIYNNYWRKAILRAKIFNFS